MTDWSKHVHRFAKKHNMTYKKANVSRKCKEAYKKRRTSPRRKMSPRRRRTSPRRKGTKKRRMNGANDVQYVNQNKVTDDHRTKDLSNYMEELDEVGLAEYDAEYKLETETDPEEKRKLEKKLEELNQRREMLANRIKEESGK